MKITNRPTRDCLPKWSMLWIRMSQTDFVMYQYLNFCASRSETFRKRPVEFPSWNSKLPDGDLLPSLWSNAFERELVALYSDAKFQDNVNDLYQYIWQQELDDVFSQTYKVAKLIHTIPATHVQTEQWFSILWRTKNYLRNTQGQERLPSLSQLNIENGLLERIMSN